MKWVDVIEQAFVLFVYLVAVVAVVVAVAVADVLIEHVGVVGKSYVVVEVTSIAVVVATLFDDDDVD